MRAFFFLFLLITASFLFLLLEQEEVLSKKEVISKCRYHGHVELIALTELKAPFAVWLWIKAFTAWEKKEWDQMASFIEETLFLEPHQIAYYEMAAWYLGWNTAASGKSDFFIQRARTLLEEGIAQNPENSLLYEQLGVLLRDKYHNSLAASAAFAKAATLPHAHFYLRRFAAYELAKSPEYYAEAYEQLKALYAEGPRERTPALLAKIKLLEKQLKDVKKGNAVRP